MDKNIKAAIIGAVITGVVSFVIFIAGNFSTQDTLEKNTVETLAGYFDSVEKDMSYKQALQVIYETSKKHDDEIAQKENEITKLRSSSKALEQENKKTINENDKLKQQLEIYRNKSNESSTDEVSNITYLSNIPIFNTQYLTWETWYSSKSSTWDKKNDKAADGKTYERAVLLSASGDYAYISNVIIFDYLLNKDYAFFSTKYMLTEISKSTASQFVISIYGDDELIYTSDMLTGGFSPVYIENLDVSNVVKMRFEISSDVGSLGNVGILLIDPTLL